MVTEYIKRGYKKGYDEEGNLVYKIPSEETIPLEVEEAPEEDTPPLNLV